MRSNDFSIQLMAVLKQRLKAQGITQEELALRLKVSLPTLKRWLAGQAVTLDNLKRLCDFLGTSMSEIALEVEDIRPPQATYTLEQEEYLALYPDCLVFFDWLVQGRSVKMICDRFKLKKAQAERYLSALENLALIDWLPHNRVRLKMTGEPAWLKNGPLSRRFKNEILASFLEDKGKGFFSLNEFLPEDIERVRSKVDELVLAARQANKRAQSAPGKSKSFGFFVHLKPFRWHLDDYLSP